MPRHDYMCPNGHVIEHVYVGEKPETLLCACGLEAVITYATWNTVRTQQSALDNKYFNQTGYYDPTLKAHISSRGQRERLVKGKGYQELSKYDKDTITRDSPLKEESDDRREERWAKAKRFADARVAPERQKDALRDLKAGKF